MAGVEQENLIESRSSGEEAEAVLPRALAAAQRTHRAGKAIAVLGILGATLIFAGLVYMYQGGQEDCSKIEDVSAWESCVAKRTEFFKGVVKSEMKKEIEGLNMTRGYQDVLFLHSKFESFLLKHRRDYHDGYDVVEYMSRFKVFKKTLELIEKRNKEDTATHGITKYADWTEEEFRALLGGKVAAGNESSRRLFHHDDLDRREEKHRRTRGGAQPTCSTEYSSRGQIRNQGACGNCWTFSTVETIRSAYIQQHGEDPGVLSTQFLTDCMEVKTCSGNNKNGCCGGNPNSAMEWIKKQGGLPTQAAYGDVFTSRRLQAAGPVSHSGEGITYSGNNPTTSYPCKHNIPKAVQLESNPKTLRSENAMEEYMCSTGSISVILDASKWQTYQSGVMSAAACGKSVDHAVVAIGLSQANSAWIVQNSWGTSWGVTVNGEAVPTDEYSNCATLAGKNKRGCHQRLTSGQTVASACQNSCYKGTPPEGGFIFLEYGADACAITTQPVTAPETVPA